MVNITLNFQRFPEECNDTNKNGSPSILCRSNWIFPICPTRPVQISKGDVAVDILSFSFLLSFFLSSSFSASSALIFRSPRLSSVRVSVILNREQVDIVVRPSLPFKDNSVSGALIPLLVIATPRLVL